MTIHSANGLDGSPSQIALITGASHGVGEAAARRLASEGYSVVINYAQDQVRADTVVDSLLASGGSALAIRADVTDELDVERLFAETVEWCGGVDAVVHAVLGQVPGGPLVGVTLDQFDALTLINTRGTFLVNREAARKVRDGGVIVNLSSSRTGSTLVGFAAHAASASATDVLTRSLAVELRGRRVRVNAVALDLAGPCEPDRVADVVLYLLSGDAGDVTGQVLGIDDPRTSRGRDGDQAPG